MEKLIQVWRNAGWRVIGSRMAHLKHTWIQYHPVSCRTLMCTALKQVRWVFLGIFVSAAVGSQKPAGRLEWSLHCWSSDVMRSSLLSISSGSGYKAISWNYVTPTDSLVFLWFSLKKIRGFLGKRWNTSKAIVHSFWLIDLFLNVFQAFSLLVMLIYVHWC